VSNIATYNTAKDKYSAMKQDEITDQSSDVGVHADIKDRLSKAERALLKIDGLYNDDTDASRIVREYFESVPIESASCEESQSEVDAQIMMKELLARKDEIDENEMPVCSWLNTPFGGGTCYLRADAVIKYINTKNKVR
jgi:hypothetical protein